MQGTSSSARDYDALDGIGDDMRDKRTAETIDRFEASFEQGPWIDTVLYDDVQALLAYIDRLERVAAAAREHVDEIGTFSALERAVEAARGNE